MQARPCNIITATNGTEAMQARPYNYITARKRWGISSDILTVQSDYLGDMECMYCGKMNTYDVGLDCPGGKAKIMSCKACIAVAERDANVLEALLYEYDNSVRKNKKQN